MVKKISTYIALWSHRYNVKLHKRAKILPKCHLVIFRKKKYGLKEKSFNKYYTISHCMPNLWALPISLYRSDNGVYKRFLNQIGCIFPYFCSGLVCLFNLCLMELIGLVWIFLLTLFNVIDILQYFVSLFLLSTMLFTAS